jgi:hypothetical protein
MMEKWITLWLLLGLCHCGGDDAEEPNLLTSGLFQLARVATAIPEGVRNFEAKGTYQLQIEALGGNSYHFSLKGKGSIQESKGSIQEAFECTSHRARLTLDGKGQVTQRETINDSCKPSMEQLMDALATTQWGIVRRTSQFQVNSVGDIHEKYLGTLESPSGESMPITFTWVYQKVDEP